MARGSNTPIIIKRKKVVAGGGHHGGAWKVAIKVDPFGGALRRLRSESCRFADEIAVLTGRGSV